MAAGFYPHDKTLFTRGLLDVSVQGTSRQEKCLSMCLSPHCQKSQSSTSRWLRSVSRSGGKSCAWELTKLLMGETGLNSSGNASDGRRLICQQQIVAYLHFTRTLVLLPLLRVTVPHLFEEGVAHECGGRWSEGKQEELVRIFMIW